MLLDKPFIQKNLILLKDYTIFAYIEPTNISKTMKKLEIPSIKALNDVGADSAGDLLEESGYKSVIEILNWPDQ